MSRTKKITLEQIAIESGLPLGRHRLMEIYLSKAIKSWNRWVRSYYKNRKVLYDEIRIKKSKSNRSKNGSENV